MPLSSELPDHRKERAFGRSFGLLGEATVTQDFESTSKDQDRMKDFAISKVSPGKKAR